jgi:anti-sigma regulatory factor (Ser/Thr protein kinase)
MRGGIVDITAPEDVVTDQPGPRAGHTHRLVSPRTADAWPLVDDERAVLRLPVHPVAAAMGRRFVRSCCERWFCPGLAEVGELLVSELLTNAYQHAGTNTRLELSHDEEGILVHVADENGSPPVLRADDDCDESGWGVRIVERLAGDWGTQQRPDGKTVWFRLDPVGGGGRVDTALAQPTAASIAGRPG